MLRTILVATLYFSTLILFAKPTWAVAAAIMSTPGNAVSSAYDLPTKVLRHHQSILDPTWITYNFDDSGWGQAYSVWDNIWWQELKWTPNGEPPDPITRNPQGLAVCAWCFMNRGTGAQVIQATGNPIQTAFYSDFFTADFFRKKFTIPATKIVKRAILYVVSDNISKFWLNGTQVVGTNNSLNNNGDCSQIIDGVEGFIYAYNVQIQPGDNILAGNNLNWRICNQSHPMGVQFYLWIEMEDAKGTVEGTVFNDLTNTCNPLDINNTNVPGQQVNLFRSNVSVGGSTSDAAGKYSITNIPIDGLTYTLVAQNTLLGTMLCCENNSPASCNVNFASTNSEHRDIAFVLNHSWLNSFDGDVYGEDALSVKIPRLGSPAPNNWLINTEAPSHAGGVGISMSQIITHQQPFDPNRTSERSSPVDANEPGWEVNKHPTDIKYLTPFKFTSSTTNVLDWKNLEKDTSYHALSASLPSGSYDLTSSGVATIYVDGALNITQDVISSSKNDEGLVIIVNGGITIGDDVAEIDAVLISNGFISTNGASDSQLVIFGGLYGLNDFVLKRDFLNAELNKEKPSMTVQFNPLYLTNLNRDFIKNSYFWEELTPQ